MHIQISKRNRVDVHIGEMEIRLRKSYVIIFEIWRTLIIFRKCDYNKLRKKQKISVAKIHFKNLKTIK